MPRPKKYYSKDLIEEIFKQLQSVPMSRVSQAMELPYSTIRRIKAGNYAVKEGGLSMKSDKCFRWSDYPNGVY